MWIKICANTNVDDALLAAEAGANAIGLVFAASPRCVTVEQAGQITPRLPESVEKIGVFVDATFEELVKAVEAGGLTGLQLHSPGNPDLTGHLREHFGDAFRILQVIHYQQGLENQLRAAQKDTAIDGVLVDSRTATLLGGTGQRYDWQAAGTSFMKSGAGLRLVVAGGLNPENVSEAIETLRPWGIDVASGVELSPGRKNPEKVRAFIENAKIAAHKAKIESPVEV
jgi:phosphoribosylanthranilate isomerase